MGIYGHAAVFARECYLQGKLSSLRDAWDYAVSRRSKSVSSCTKACPKDAFLGLCEAGLVKGIPAGKYGAPRDNRNGRYAVDAYNILHAEPKLANDKNALWERIPEPKARNENSQMDVLLTLLNNRMLV
jgi:hypothetical protein